MVFDVLRVCCVVGPDFKGISEAIVDVRRRQVIKALSSESVFEVAAAISMGIIVVAKSFRESKTNGDGSDVTPAMNVPAFAIRLRRRVPVWWL